MRDAPEAIEWTSQEYARRLKEAFQRADRSGAGVVTRKELADIIQDLDHRHWSDEELGELFGAVDPKSTGFIRYAVFISYLMETPLEDDEAEREEEEQGLDEFADRNLQLEGRPEVNRNATELDPAIVVSSDQWAVVMQNLADETEKEARSTFSKLQEQLSLSPHKGIPVEYLLRQLGVQPDDHGAMRAVVEALASRGDARKPSGSTVLRRALHQLARSLHLGRRIPGDATQVLSEGLVPLSQAEREAVQQLGRDPRRLTEQLEAFSREPPMLSALAGLRACQELCAQEVSSIIAKCRASGRRFTDHSWDLGASPAKVLYVDGHRPGYDCTVGRPARVRRMTRVVATSAIAPATAVSALYGGSVAPGAGAARAAGAAREAVKPVLVKDGRPGEIMQGQIGTCYLLGAMGAIAAGGPDMVRSLFVKYDIDMGVYGVRLNVDGEWTYVIVDDHMPVDENGELLYARCVDSAEVWCPILEKAFCKLHTCYEMCDGGQTSEAVAALTGGISGRIRITQVHREEPRRYFRLLQQARARGWLLTTDFCVAGSDPSTSSTTTACSAARARGKCGESLLPSGLIAGHTYSLVGIVEALGHQLVCLRNPWGSGEWTGKWSGANAQGEWTPAMRKVAGFTGADDGRFWMSIEDFVERSAGVDYSWAFGPDWRKVSQYSRFRHGELLATARCDYAAMTEDEINFSAGDQIQVTGLCGAFWWRGRVWRVRASGESKTRDGFFPAGRVQVNQHPVARFDLRCSATWGAREPMTAVVVLSQPNAPMQRRYFRRREDGLNCKDVSYPRLQLSIVDSQGQVIAKRAGRRRCLWVELELAGSGSWRIGAHSLDGLGSSFSVRVYAKGGEASLVEVLGEQDAESFEGQPG